MATSAFVPDLVDVARAPRPSLLWALALAGGAAAASSLPLVLTSDAASGGIGEPLVLALLSSWITIAYVLCGLIAWSRRPASRFGPLLIAAGFASFLTDLSWITSDVPFTTDTPSIFCHPCFSCMSSWRIRAVGCEVTSSGV